MLMRYCDPSIASSAFSTSILQITIISLYSGIMLEIWDYEWQLPSSGLAVITYAAWESFRAHLCFPSLSVIIKTSETWTLHAFTAKYCVFDHTALKLCCVTGVISYTASFYVHLISVKWHFQTDLWLLRHSTF